MNEFIWDLLFHIIPLYQFDEDGKFVRPLPGNDPTAIVGVAAHPNWELVANLLPSLINKKEEDKVVSAEKEVSYFLSCSPFGK